jgi:hypothetical protein
LVEFCAHEHCLKRDFPAQITQKRTLLHVKFSSAEFFNTIGRFLPFLPGLGLARRRIARPG